MNNSLLVFYRVCGFCTNWKSRIGTTVEDSFTQDSMIYMYEISLGHLTQRVVWTINITLCPLSSLLFSTVNFYISIFFSKFTGPMEIKLGRNVHWMVPYRFYEVLFCSNWKFIMTAWANNAFWLVKIRKNLFRNRLADFIVIL